MTFIASILIGIFALSGATSVLGDVGMSPRQPNFKPSATTEFNAIDEAFAHRRSNLQVRAIGTVFKLLADDNYGSRHQKFLVRLSSGLTVLIAHNIDLAPRIKRLKASDGIEFYGEYEWSEKGGVVHWTHRDPKGRHLAGWIKHKGEIYQ